MRFTKTFYRRHLPHIQLIGATFFVTFRLYDSIPVIKLKEIRTVYDEKIAELRKTPTIHLQTKIYEAQKRFFAQYDALLDKILQGPAYLCEWEMAAIVKTELHRYDGTLYELLAYCIMPNHVHVLFNTNIQLIEIFDFSDLEQSNYKPLCQIMKNIKGVSAMYCNRVLERHGQFWQRESFDHYVRNERELNNIVAYILNNPIKAGLVQDWEQWKDSYVHPGFL